MSTGTTNFNFLKPDVGSLAEKERWGTILNTAIDAIDSQLKTRTSSYDFDNYELIDAKIKSAKETLYNFTGDISAGAVTINYNNGNYQYANLTSNCAITFSNFPTDYVGGLSLHIKQDATGSRAVTFTNSYKTAGGLALNPITTANAINIYRVECIGTAANPYYIFLNAQMA